jgi:hypothetical protein
MAPGIEGRVARIRLAVGILLCSASAITAQNIAVDAAPAHVANSFSPLRALDGAIGAHSRMYDERYFEQLSLTIFKSVTVM